MSYSFIKVGTNTANSNTISFTPTNTGDLLMLWSRTSTGAGNPTLTSCVDNTTTSWTQGLATVDVGAISENIVSMFYLPNCGSGITSVTCTYNGGTPGACDLLIAEYSGMATSSPFIGISTGVAQTAPGTTTDAIASNAFNVTTGVPALIFGIVLNGGDSDTVAGTGYTGRMSGNNSWFCEDKRATSTGNVTATATAPTHGGGDSYITYVSAWSEAVAGPNISPGPGGLTVTGNTPTVTPAQNTVIQTFVARHGGQVLEPDRRIRVPERRIFIPGRKIAA